MASITRDYPNKTYYIQIVVHGKRFKLRHNFRNRQIAKAIAEHLEELKADSGLGFLPRQTKQWVEDVFQKDPELYQKIASMNLVEFREPCGTIAELVKRFVPRALKTTPKEHTTRNRQVSANMLLRYLANQPVGNFKANEGALKKAGERLVNTIKKEDADRLLEFMQSTYSPATWGRRIKTIQALFGYAVKLGWIQENPFSHLRGCSETDRSRFYYVKPQEAQTVLAACPNTRAKLIFALGRWGGLRIPSGLSQIRRWGIDWETGKIIINSPKLTSKFNQDHGLFHVRAIPIWPEIQPILQNYLAEMPEEQDQLFPEIDGSDRCGAQIRKEFGVIMSHAGLKPWPKFFMNLRSTRATELQNEGFPLHTVCYWMGHSPQTSLNHYIQITDEDFRFASYPHGRTAGQKRGR